MFVAGGGYPLRVIRIERVVYTNKPIERVWDYLSDFTNTTEWDPGTVRTVRLSGDGGIGTEYRNTSKFAGRKTELVYVVKELVEREKISLRGSNKSVDATDTIMVRDTSSGTEVTYVAEFEFKGLAKRLEPVLKRPVNKLGDDGQQGLRDALSRL
jgi:uncharacterized protein YndB with AHSA1/START domain